MEKKIIKRFTLVKIIERNIDNEVKGELYFGRTEGYYYSLSYPQTIYDTEEEAIDAIKKNDLYGNWMILPVYSYEYVY